MEPTKLTPYQLERNRLKFSRYIFILLFASFLHVLSFVFATRTSSFFDWLPSSGDRSMGVFLGLIMYVPVISVIQLISIMANILFISLTHKNVRYELKVFVNAIIMTVFAYIMAQSSYADFYKAFTFILVFPLIPLTAADLFLTKLVNQDLLQPESGDSMRQTIEDVTGRP